MNASTQAQLAVYLPVILIGLLLFVMAKWGGARIWQLVLAVLSGLILAGTILGPPIAALLSQVSGGHLH